MPRPRRARPRGRGRAPRLVAPERVEALVDAEDWRLDPDALPGWRVGLATAGYLRGYFPAFWAEHVAGKAITTARLLGAFHAFIELADDELLAIDAGHHCPLDLGVPAANIPTLIDGYRDEGGILWTLSNELWHWVYQPPVACYGLDADELGEAWRDGRHRLCLALWWMLRETAWQQLGLSGSHVRTLRGGRQIARLPCIHADVPMDAFADALTWTVALDGVTEPWELGDILRLVCGQTGNEFADVSTAEAAQDMAWWCEGIYEHPTRLLAECEKQRRARALRAAYDALDKRVRKEPPLLDHLAHIIVQTAGRVVAERQPGRPLAEVLGRERREEPCAA